VIDHEWAFAMVDLAGFTAPTESHGDAHAADLATEFEAIARDSLAEADRFVKAIGDVVLLASPTPLGGLRLVDRILTSCRDQAGFLITRTGLHHGPAIQRGDDFFGATVNLTARLASHASGGQVLGTTVIAEAARTRGNVTRELGEISFKNVTTPVAVHELDLGTPIDTVESIDPVCRMRVAHTTAAGYLRHEGSEYWFCSLD
jgi:adenylate cyclase